MKEILWQGIVNGLRSQIWFDGHTSFINDRGTYERASDLNPIIAQAISQLVEKSNQDTEKIRKYRDRAIR